MSSEPRLESLCFTLPPLGYAPSLVRLQTFGVKACRAFFRQQATTPATVVGRCRHFDRLARAYVVAEMDLRAHRSLAAERSTRAHPRNCCGVKRPVAGAWVSMVISTRFVREFLLAVEFARLLVGLDQPVQGNLESLQGRVSGPEALHFIR